MRRKATHKAVPTLSNRAERVSPRQSALMLPPRPLFLFPSLQPLLCRTPAWNHGTNHCAHPSTRRHYWLYAYPLPGHIASSNHISAHRFRTHRASSRSLSNSAKPHAVLYVHSSARASVHYLSSLIYATFHMSICFATPICSPIIPMRCAHASSDTARFRRRRPAHLSLYIPSVKPSDITIIHSPPPVTIDHGNFVLSTERIDFQTSDRTSYQGVWPQA